MMKESLAEKLRVLRAQHGLSVSQAAERIGIDRHTLRRLELGGGRQPQYPTLSKIASGYGVPVEELLEQPTLSLGEGRSAAESSSVEIDVDPRIVEGGVPAEVLVVARDAFVQAMERVRDHEWSVEEAERELERLGYLWGPLREQVRRHARWGE